MDGGGGTGRLGDVKLLKRGSGRILVGEIGGEVNGILSVRENTGLIPDRYSNKTQITWPSVGEWP
jgi:hypothetical protein